METEVSKIEGTLHVLHNWLKFYSEDFEVEMIVFVTLLLQNYRNCKVSNHRIHDLEFCIRELKQQVKLN
jgi:hypothetical protein